MACSEEVCGNRMLMLPKDTKISDAAEDLLLADLPAEKELKSC